MRKFLLASFIASSLLLLWVPFALAKEQATPELTLQQAIDMAAARSKNLQNASYEIERTEEARRLAADKVRYVPAPGSSPASEDAAAVIGLEMADINWQKAKKDYEAKKDALVMSVTRAYYDVVKAEEGVRVAELNYQNAEISRQVALASYKTGMTAKSSLVQAEAGLAGAKSALEAARKALDDAYQQFNALVGLWPEDRPVLVDSPTFTPLQVDNVEVEVVRAVEGSPTIWMAQRNIELAKLNLDLYVFNNPKETETYTGKAIKVNQAEVSAAEAEENLRKTMRSTYYSIRQLEENYAGLEQKLAAAAEDLRVTRVKYEVGMATKQEVVAAEASLAGIKKSLLDTVCDHEILKLAFKKPWASAAASGVGSGSSSDSVGSSEG